MVKWALKLLSASLVTHVKLLGQQLDPILDLDADHHQFVNSKITLHFLVPLIVSAIVVLYGILWLHLEAGEQLTIEALQRSPYVFTHQVSSSAERSQIDTMFALDLLSIGLIYTILLLNNYNRKPKYQMAVTDQEGQVLLNGKAFPKSESEKILRFRAKVKFAIVKVASPFFYLLILAYMFTNVWLNDVYRVTVASVGFWLLIIPLCVFYIVYGKNFFRLNYL